MATVSTSIPSFFSNSTDFRTWGSTISAALATCGLVQTADTGQINWTTVTLPGTTATAAGYEIWRFADTLQATAPVFIKVEYGTGSSTDKPSMWITVGSSSNSSGTITGQAGTRVQCGSSLSKTTGATALSRIAGTSGRIAAAVNYDSADGRYLCYWQVSRTADASGADTADGVFFASMSGSGFATRMTIPASGTVPSATSSTAWVQTDAGSTPQSATATPFSPAILFANGKMLFNITWSHYRLADVTAGTPVTVSAFGSSRTFMPLGSPSISPSWTGSSAPGIAMLWE